MAMHDIFLGGYPPFQDDNQAELFERIKCAQFKFDPQCETVLVADCSCFT